MVSKLSHHWLHVVTDNYSGWGDQKLVDDLFTLFCTSERTKRLLTELATHKGLQKRQNGLQKNVTGSDTVCPILDLRMPKRRYVAYCTHVNK